MIGAPSKTLLQVSGITSERTLTIPLSVRR
jgi:hypothetical protein